MKNLINLLSIILLTIFLGNFSQAQEKSPTYKKMENKGNKNSGTEMNFIQTTPTKIMSSQLNKKVKLLDKYLPEIKNSEKFIQLPGEENSVCILFREETSKTYPMYISCSRDTSKNYLKIELLADTSLPGEIILSNYKIIFRINYEISERYFEINELYLTKWFENSIGKQRYQRAKESYKIYKKYYKLGYKKYLKQGFSEEEIIRGIGPVLEQEKFIFHYVVKILFYRYLTVENLSKKL
jgi:hypothetical protein